MSDAKYGFVWRHLKHRGGTKEYVAILITNRQNNSGLFITRWGRIGTEGQHMVQVGTDKDALQRYVEKIKQKENNGYIAFDESNQKSGDFNAVYAMLDWFRLWKKMDPEHLHQVFGGDWKNPEPESPPEPIPVKLKPSPVNEYADDPLWGSF
jgi:predicted DNA-binding WGR domain protein